jgi:hypothetical protein
MNVANAEAATADEESDDDDALTGSFVADARNQFSAALRSSLTNRYLCAVSCQLRQHRSRKDCPRRELF